LKDVAKWGMGGKGVREINGCGRVNQSKANPQWAYIEKSL
jgi:hypothetical protein